MHELSEYEVFLVAGGEKKKENPKDKKEQPPPKSGTATRPTAGESERGREFNDAAGALNALGSWLGIAIYDATHKQK